MGVRLGYNNGYMTKYRLSPSIYLTPLKLHKYKPEISSLCFRCFVGEGSFFTALGYAQNLIHTDMTFLTSSLNF